MATNPNDPFSLEGLGLSNENLPPELGSAVLQNLDAILGRQEQRQTRSLLDQQEERGLFRSGQTEDRLQQEILEPSIDNRRQALLQLVGQGTGQAREERLQGVQFGREKEMQSLQFEQRMKELEQMLSNQKELLRLQDDIGDGNRPGFWESFGMNFAGGAGQGAGAATSKFLLG